MGGFFSKGYRKFFFVQIILMMLLDERMKLKSGNLFIYSHHKSKYICTKNENIKNYIMFKIKLVNF